MKKTILIYSAAIAAAAFGLQWLEYQYSVRVFSIQIYIVIIALVFTALGAWVGHMLSRTGEAKPFEKNVRAIRHLGISNREYEVLELLAEGRSNKEIAESLFVSPNTIKTHLTHLYGKLDVSRRPRRSRKRNRCG